MREEPGQAEEAELVARSQRGESAAFSELVAIHRNKVFATIYNVVRNEQDAWDLAQETFLKAWKNIAHFRGQSSFYTWLYRIGMNLSLDWLRHKRIEGGVEFDETVGLKQIEPGSATTPKAAPLPHRRMENSEIQSRIDNAIEKLSPEHRMVIVLREIEDLSYEEIAEATGCSVGTVMSRLFYARKKLQTLLRDVYETI